MATPICFLALLAIAQATVVPPLLASESDHGALVYRGDKKNAHFYSVKELDGTDKIHVLISVGDCRCVAEGDVHKINQIDYLLASGHLFSYAIYTDSEGPCGLNSSVVQAKTSLRVSRLESGGEVTGDVAYITRHRLEGRVLAQGMRDFYESDFVGSNRAEIFETDKSGGVLMLQGNVGFRPCKLFPWFMPWIYNDYNSRHHVMIGVPEQNLVYYNEEAATETRRIFEQAKTDGIIKNKHLDNLEDNTGSKNEAVIFSFQAVFVPHRFADEFRRLLEPWHKSGLSPFIYVPLVMELMFDKNEWIEMRRQTHNETIRLMEEALLESCNGMTVAEMQVSERGASALAWFAASYCGFSFTVTITHVVSEIEKVTGRSVYMVLFFVLLSFVCCVFLCVYRRGVFRMLGLCYGKYLASRPMIIRESELTSFRKVEESDDEDEEER